MLSIADALIVKKRAERRLFAIPGVHTVGLGAKLTGGRPAGELAIIVYVLRKKPRAEMPADELIPTEIEGVKTDVVEGSPGTVRFAPLQGGDEITAQHATAGEIYASTGTLGCIARSAAVLDTAPPDVLLSCRHVLFQENNLGAPGDSIIVSSCSGCCESTVASLLSGPPISADIDAALAKFAPGVETKAQMHNVAVTGTLDLLSPSLPAAVQSQIAAQTYRVYQYGATSSFTRGVITDIHASGTESPSQTLSGQIAIKGVDRPYFTQKGDSGSVVYNDGGQIVGLHWGGSVDVTPKLSFANHISKVLAAFPGLRIATNPPVVIYRTPGVRRLPSAVERLHVDLVNAGCIDYYMGLYGRYEAELRWLFADSRHFVSAWHRNHGPKIVRALMDLLGDRVVTLPEAIAGRSWKSCVHRIAGALLYAGTESLQADVLRHVSFASALGGSSYPELLQLMRSVARVAN